MKKRKYITIGIIILFLILIFLLINYFFFNKKYDFYKIVYFDDYIPGSKYEININNNKIEVIKTRFCSAINCGPRDPEIDEFSYSNEEKEKLYEFLLNNFEFNNNSLEITKAELNDNQKKIIDGIIYKEYNIK